MGMGPQMNMGGGPGMGGDYANAPPLMQDSRNMGMRTGGGIDMAMAPPSMRQQGPMPGPMQAPGQGPGQGINYNALFANANANGYRGDTAPQGGPIDQQKGIVLAEGSNPMSGAVTPRDLGPGGFAPASSPTYLNGITALLGYGGPNGPTAPPQDPRMVWGMGNAGGTPGYQLVNGYNGYRK